MNEKTPILAKRILILTIIASCFDAAGDEGTRMARGTIVSNVFPEWSTTERQNYLLLAMIVVILFSVSILEAMKKCMNLGGIATIGCFFTLAVQVILMIEWDVAPYLVFWHFGKLFGFLSTIASGLIIQDVAPKEQLGYWNGRLEALMNLSTGIAPLIFAPIYDGIGNVRGQEMLGATAAVSFFATVAYIPLIKMLPKKKPPPKEDELQDLSVYDSMSDVEYAALPMETVDKITEMKIKAGEAPRTVSWGDYKIERPTLGELQVRSLKDFNYLNQAMIELLTSKDKMVKEQENFRLYQDLMPKVDREAAKNEMGEWLASYFDDAGYLHWETNCTLYKAMLMNAFPPIDPLDDVKPDYATMSLDHWEHILTKFLAVMDEHLAVSQRHYGGRLAANTAVTLFRRR